MRKIVLLVSFVCLLGNISLWGGPLKFSKAGKRLADLSGKILRKEGRHTPQRIKIGKFLQKKSKTAVPTTPLKPFSMVKQQRLAIEAPSLPTNTISCRMQQQIAKEMRPFLYSFHSTSLPEEAPDFKDEYFGVMTLGNLTKLSPAQYESALQAYQAAMHALEDLSSYVNTTIYYMGTPETSGEVNPLQIIQMTKEIAQVRALVEQARVSWGDDPTLQRAVTYLNNLTQFYRILGTGVHEKIGVQPEMIARTDGHVYNEREFGLTSENLETKIPSWRFMDPTTWFTNEARGVLPHNLRVAVLQDDQDVIRGINRMQKKAGLGDWQIDFYDDPEEFLNQASYAHYDMILTDILIKNGGGRYLARQLRNRGYDGSILALSGFEPEYYSGKCFFNDGIDGMISISWTNDIAGSVWNRLMNYFLLKEKYGWKH